ncbi:MAG TPA: FecR family protein [Kofleriaceae bacterium]|nr:FecR family protein [Kofleriaceae bacterium]
MKLRDRIPVEQLDDERLTNIERRLVVGVSELSTQRASRRGLAAIWFRGAGVLAIAAAAMLGWKLHAVPASEPPAAPAPQHFAVVDGSRISVAGATLAGSASYDVTRDGQRVVIDMQRGKLELAVVHDPQRTLVIRAADTEIEDVGTKFRVDFDGANDVQVRVTEGEVKVTRHAQIVRVAAGNGWTTEHGLIALAELDPVVVAFKDPTPPPAPVPGIAPVPARPHTEGGARAPHHVAETVPAVPQHREPVVTAPADPYVELRTAIRSVPLERAPNIDGRTDAASEIAKLKKLAYSTTVGPEASQALYQIAVLLYRPLGQDAEAMHTLDWYFRRFAGGKEMHAAMWLRVRIACDHSIDEACRRAAYSYQHDVPSGAASDVAVRITNAQ